MKKGLKVKLLIFPAFLLSQACEKEWKGTTGLDDPENYHPPTSTCQTPSDIGPSLKPKDQEVEINLTQTETHTINLTFPECHQIQDITFGSYVFTTTSITIDREDFYPYLTKEQQDSNETYCSVTPTMKYKLKSSSGTSSDDIGDGYVDLKTFTILIPCQKPQDDKNEEDMGEDMKEGD